MSEFAYSDLIGKCEVLCVVTADSGNQFALVRADMDDHFACKDPKGHPLIAYYRVDDRGPRVSPCLQVRRTQLLLKCLKFHDHAALDAAYFFGDPAFYDPHESLGIGCERFSGDELYRIEEFVANCVVFE